MLGLNSPKEFMHNGSLSKKKPHTFKNRPVEKNPQFLSNPHETW